MHPGYASSMQRKHAVKIQVDRGTRTHGIGVQCRSDQLVSTRAGRVAGLVVTFLFS